MSKQLEENKELLKKYSLKITEPRLTILSLIQDTREEKQHFTAEDIYKNLLTEKSDIGLATVYRVLNQFEEVGILLRHNFEVNKSVFELNKDQDHHHIICKNCGQVFEFEDKEMEERQREIGQKYGIELEKRSLYLYGNCHSHDCNDTKA